MSEESDFDLELDEFGIYRADSEAGVDDYDQDGGKKINTMTSKSHEKSEELTHWSERYSLLTVGPTFLNREMQIVSNLPALPKSPTVPFFFVLPAPLYKHGRKGRKQQQPTH